MSQRISAWRATYTPGHWVALAGPTSLVVLQPAPARVSGLLNRFWDDVLRATSIHELSSMLAQHNLAQLAGFCLLFWDENGLHSLTRGPVRIADAGTGRELATGEGVVTWTETALGKDASIRIEVEPVDPAAVLHLPLIVGGASVSSVFLTTHADALVRSAQVGILPDSGGAHAALVHDPKPGVPDAADGEITAGIGLAPPLVPLPVGVSATDDVSVPEQDAPAGDEPASEFAGDPASLAPDASGEAREDAREACVDGVDEAPSIVDAGYLVPGFDAPSDPSVAPLPMAAPVSPMPLSAGIVPPVGSSPQQTSPSREHPTQQKPSASGLVPATVCALGHANPPGTLDCRQCHGPVGSISRLMPRPVLAVVRSSFGVALDLSSKVLVGRAPDTKGDTSVQVLKVPSPNTDISRSHLKIEANEWQVELTDLNSTNGSVVAVPGRQPEKMQPGQSTVVPIGTIVDLGDGVQLRIDPPR